MFLSSSTKAFPNVPLSAEALVTCEGPSAPWSKTNMEIEVSAKSDDNKGNCLEGGYNKC